MTTEEMNTKNIMLKYIEALEKVCIEHSLVPVIQRLRFDAKKKQVITSGLGLIPLPETLIKKFFESSKENVKELDENLVTKNMEKIALCESELNQND